MKIKIWSPENADEADADEQEMAHYDPEDLPWALGFRAEEWLNGNHSRYDHCDELEVAIRLLDYPHAEAKTLWRFHVGVEMEPVFRACELKTEP